MTNDDLVLCKEFLQSPEAAAAELDILNTRVFKESDTEFLLTVGSITEEGSCDMAFRGKTFKVRKGEFSHYLREMNFYL